MSDLTVAAQIDALIMGAPSQPTSQRITSDRDSGETSITSLPVAQSQIASSSGDVSPVQQFNGEMATEQHLLLAGKLSDIESQLAAVTYDTKTGATSPAVTGAERNILEMQKAQFANELQWLAHRAVDQLPKVGIAKDAQAANLEAAAKRAANISALADAPDSTGKPVCRGRAAQRWDEAEHRALADRLVRGK
jgi:hypothetical protein